MNRFRRSSRADSRLNALRTPTGTDRSPIGSPYDELIRTAFDVSVPRSARTSRRKRRRRRRRARRTIFGRHPALTVIGFVILGATPVWVSLGSRAQQSREWEHPRNSARRVDASPRRKRNRELGREHLVHEPRTGGRRITHDWGDPAPAVLDDQNGSDHVHDDADQPRRLDIHDDHHDHDDHDDHDSDVAHSLGKRVLGPSSCACADCADRFASTAR